MDGNNRDQNPKPVPGRPGAKVKDFLRDRDRDHPRDNPDGEEIQRGIIEEARRQLVHRQQLGEDVDSEDLSVRHGHPGQQLSFADENSVDREERESHQGRHRRRGSVSSEEQFERWRWLRECWNGFKSVFIEPFQSGGGSHRRRKWYEYTKEEFRQQKLPVLCEPIFNFKFVGRWLLYLSILTVPLAIVLFLLNAETKELRFTFGEECKNARNYLRLIRTLCTFCGGNLNPNCHKGIEITEDIKLPVYLYYELEGFHQNHRKLTRAMDSDQLMGKIFDGEMKPVRPDNCGDYTEDDNGKIYFPCGALANLMFNDDFALITPSGEEVPLRTHGVAWSGLKYHRFKNPPSEIVNQKDYHLRSAFKDNFVKPKDWTTEMWDDWWSLGANENERFINWMNPSAFSHMRKMYAVIDSVPMCPIGILCKGNYTMNIEYRYDVDRFEGNKAFILATTSFFGGRNHILPYVVAAIGSLQFALGIIMTQLHNRCGIKDQCAFSRAEVSTIGPSQGRSRSRSSRYTQHDHGPTQVQHHQTFTDNPRQAPTQRRNDDQNDSKPIITKYKRTSGTPVLATQKNPNSNSPPTKVVVDQSYDTVLDIDNSSAVVFKTAVASSTAIINPAAASSTTAEGGIANRPGSEPQRRGGGEKEVSLLYLNQDPSSFQRESIFVFPDNLPRRRHGRDGAENASLNDSSVASDTDTEDDATLISSAASSAVQDVVSDAESIVSYWSNGTSMMTADESSSEADEGREGMMGGGGGGANGGSVPRKRRLQ